MANIDNHRFDTQAPSQQAEIAKTAPKDSTERLLGPQQSMASSPHTLHNALIAAKEFILKNEWSNARIIVDTANNPEAARWQLEASRLKVELQDPNVKQLFESKAATNADEINRFLASKGFSISLRDDWAWLYVASVFKQKVEWKKTWTATKIEFLESNRLVDGVEMSKWNITKYTSQWKEIYELATKNGDKVFMMQVGNDKITPINLYQKIRDIHEWKGNWTPWNILRFPKVKLDENGSIDWIVWAKVWSYTVKQALYQNKLEMDEQGAIAEAAVATGWSKSLSSPPPPKVDTINWPMYVWFVKPGANGNDVITFAARIGENAMTKSKPDANTP